MALPAKTHLIFLPGMLCTERLFSHQLEHLGREHNAEVGDMASGRTVGEIAESVLLNAPERFSLVGLSLGAIVAMEVAVRAPERVERLALLDSSPRPPRPDQLEAWRNFEEITDAGRFPEVTERHLIPTLLHPERLSDSALTAEVERMALAVGADAFRRQLDVQRSRRDLREDLGGVVCPVLVAAGRQDALCPPEVQREIREAVPGARLVFVEDCGHLSSIERPSAITALLSYWLQKGKQ